MATREMALPFAIDPLGRVAFVEDPAVQVGQHLQLLIGTQVRTRLMALDYGVDLLGYVFDTNDISTEQRLFVEIESAVQTWEPQAVIQAINVNPDDSTADDVLSLIIEYSVGSDDAPANTATVEIDGTTVTTSG